MVNVPLIWETLRIRWKQPVTSTGPLPGADHKLENYFGFGTPITLGDEWKPDREKFDQALKEQFGE